MAWIGHFWGMHVVQLCLGAVRGAHEPPPLGPPLFPGSVAPVVWSPPLPVGSSPAAPSLGSTSMASGVQALTVANQVSRMYRLRTISQLTRPPPAQQRPLARLSERSFLAQTSAHHWRARVGQLAAL